MTPRAPHQKAQRSDERRHLRTFMSRVSVLQGATEIEVKDPPDFLLQLKDSRQLAIEHRELTRPDRAAAESTAQKKYGSAVLAAIASLPGRYTVQAYMHANLRHVPKGGEADLALVVKEIASRLMDGEQRVAVHEDGEVNQAHGEVGWLSPALAGIFSGVAVHRADSQSESNFAAHPSEFGMDIGRIDVNALIAAVQEKEEKLPAIRQRIAPDVHVWLLLVAGDSINQLTAGYAPKERIQTAFDAVFVMDTFTGVTCDIKERGVPGTQP